MEGEVKYDSPSKFLGGDMVLEREYQAKLIRRIKDTFPGSKVLKTDPTQLQGIPDLIILFEDKWAALETKRGPSAPVRPNQQYYIDELNEMGGFASFIHPQNESKVLRWLKLYFLEEG